MIDVVVLFLTLFLLATGPLAKVLQNWAPYLSVLLSIIVIAIGRFIWQNRQSSDTNESRIERLGRTMFGDDKDTTRPGLVERLNEIENRLDEIEDRLDDD